MNFQTIWLKINEYLNDIKEYILKLIEYTKKHKTLTISGVSLFLFITIYYILLYHVKNNLFKRYSFYLNIVFFIIFIIWGFSLYVKQELNTPITTEIINQLRRIFFISLFLIAIFSIFYFLSSYKTFNNILFLALNLIVFGIIIYGVYYIFRYFIKTLKQNKYYQMIANIVTFIPTLFNNLINIIKNNKQTQLYTENKSTYFYILFIEIVAIILFFTYPLIMKYIYAYGGIQLLNKPIYTDKERTIGTFENLKHQDKFIYNYSISGWLYIDNISSNYNKNSNHYTNLLNYGEKPSIQYNASKNMLRVIFEDSNENEDIENNKKILFETSNIKLQKWNHFVINYNSGVVDIFINNELVSTTNNNISYMTIENIITGSENGIPGGICNVIYYPNTLSKYHISLLYNTIKNKTPPFI